MSFDYRINKLISDAAAEKEAQLASVKAILLPIFVATAVIVFALAFWRYEIGLPLSIGAAILTLPALGLMIATPIGYILGQRAARRLKARIVDPED